MGIVYLNGQLLPEEQAKIPVTDRGFLFGDGVYEVIPAYGGTLFRLDEHLNRLQDSLDGIRIRNPYSTAQWRQRLQQLLDANPNPQADYSIYLQITRGSAPRRNHAFPQEIHPTIFASATPIIKPLDETYAQGVSAITLEDTRWKQCHIKAITLLPNILLRQQAVDAGAAEAILLKEGYLTEGAASNVFVVLNNEILTPPKSPELLPGITRDVVLELAQQQGLAHGEVQISEQQLREASEIWLTSSTREILAVTLLDGLPVGDGKPGPQWSRIYSDYQAFKKQLRQHRAR
ncbi:D-alanine aminotransferase [hydrothermal vent metagenome]|uniref:D-alanine aminotransferase n=1 Tax=hydrothermal vent metagenome TaxID=652676 RepID=A0A3B0ZNZ4_9ZZZZ